MLVEFERKYLCMLVSALWRALQRGVEHDTCGMGHRLLIFSVQYGMVLYSTVHIYKLTLHLGWLPVDSRPVSGILAPAPATPPETSCGTRWTPGDTRGHQGPHCAHIYYFAVHFMEILHNYNVVILLNVAAPLLFNPSTCSNFTFSVCYPQSN